MPARTRTLAIDWSGAARGARNKIWLAEVSGGQLTRLECGRTRRQITEHLAEEARRDPNLIVGLDFAFSFPVSFLKERGLSDALALWDLATDQGEAWLKTCDPPFWGRPGCPRPSGGDQWRRTEGVVRDRTKAQPKSVFQVGGAGAVGTGSIRGMPVLADLARAGFSIWPFHGAKPPLVVEIYPRLLTGAVVKNDPVERATYLARDLPELSEEHVRLAASSEDAFDAAVSAVVMARHTAEILALPPARDETERLEGAIWFPEPSEATKEEEFRGVESNHIVQDCPFCAPAEERILHESTHALALPDAYPVTDGHTLVVPKRHVERLFDLPAHELRDLWTLVARTREHLRERHAPDGFTIGVNDGPAAGQTVPHAHVHVIPRRTKDVKDPRGGIRWVVPENAAYWEEP